MRGLEERGKEMEERGEEDTAAAEDAVGAVRERVPKDQRYGMAMYTTIFPHSTVTRAERGWGGGGCQWSWRKWW